MVSHIFSDLSCVFGLWFYGDRKRFFSGFSERHISIFHAVVFRLSSNRMDASEETISRKAGQSLMSVTYTIRQES